MPDPDTLFELEDARRKVTTSNALLAYREACAETLVIEAGEEQRKTRAQLIILEARYEKLYQEYSEDKDYFERMELALREAYASLRWHEDAVARYKVKNRELQDKHQRNLVGERDQQEIEVAALQASLEGALGVKKTLQEHILQLEDELLKAATKKSTVDAELSKHKEELEAYKTTTDALKAQLTEWEEKHRGSVAECQSLQQEASTLRLDLQKQQTADKNQSLQQEVISLRSELEKIQAALKKASETATAEREKDGKRKSQEVVDLKTALRKETKAREKAEKDLAKSKEDWEAKHEVLESKLESTRSKLTALRASSASASAPPPVAAAATAAVAKASTSSATTSIASKLPAQNSKKRASTLTMEDLELSAKRPRKTPPKTSEFSITPFLKRQTAAADTSVANATTISTTTTAAVVISEADAPEAPETGETTMIPALIESKEPTKILLAGANRKRKAKNSTTEPDIPEATTAEESGKPKPKPRKRKPAAAKTLFTEDDGSGRLTLAPLAESQELPAPRTAVAMAAGGKKGKKPGGGGLAGALAGDACLLVPSVTAFNNEFSPAKKRPEGLKKLFGGK